MHILAPTDFSKNASNAIRYAAEVSMKMKAHLTILHVLQIVAPPRFTSLRANKLEETLILHAREDGKNLINKLKRKFSKLDVQFEITNESSIPNALTAFARNQKVNLIIMGTKGASGLAKIFLGSNTASLIGNCPIPIMAIPQHCPFGNLRTIAYASDGKDTSRELNKLISFFDPLHPAIRILHVVPPGEKSTMNFRNKIERYKEKYNNNISYIQIHNSNIEDGILGYILHHQVDLLTLFVKNNSLLQKVQGKSSTNELALQARTPLLVWA